MPEDWKTMLEIGSGVFEIRIHKSDEYRVIYVAKFSEAVYVFQYKTLSKQTN
jgi:phage-related protein